MSSHLLFQDNLQILRDLSLLQIQMRDLEGYKVTCFTLNKSSFFSTFCLMYYYIQCHIKQDTWATIVIEMTGWYIFCTISKDPLCVCVGHALSAVGAAACPACFLDRLRHGVSPAQRLRHGNTGARRVQENTAGRHWLIQCMTRRNQNFKALLLSKRLSCRIQLLNVVQWG